MNRSRFISAVFATCVSATLFMGCAGPKGFSVQAPEKPVIDYTGVPYDEAWKDLVAFMEGDAKWCMGSIEDMSKQDGYVRTSWRASHTSMPYQTRVMARFNDDRTRVEFTPEAMFETVPGYSTDIAGQLKTSIGLHDSKRRLARTEKMLSVAPPERKLKPETAEDKVIAQRLVGTWKAALSGELTTRTPNNPPSHSTWKSETTYIIRADGTIAETMITMTPSKNITTTAAGTWAVRGDRFYVRRDMRGINGKSIKSDVALLMIWKDADRWEMRDDPADEVNKARKLALGNTSKTTYDADGAQRTVSENEKITVESVSTACIFNRVAPSGAN